MGGLEALDKPGNKITVRCTFEQYGLLLFYQDYGALPLVCYQHKLRFWGYAKVQRTIILVVTMLNAPLTRCSAP